MLSVHSSSVSIGAVVLMGKLKYSEKNLSHCPLHDKSHTCTCFNAGNTWLIFFNIAVINFDYIILSDSRVISYNAEVTCSPPELLIHPVMVTCICY
jgi:hypothetical protein